MNKSQPVTPALAAYVADMLCKLVGGEATLLRAAVTRLLEVLEEGGTCIELSELGDASDVGRRLAGLPVVGGAGDERPLIIDGPRLYLHRYHCYEARLATQLLQLAARVCEPPSGAQGYERKLLAHALGIVTGGPGTGKTTLASRILGVAAVGVARPLRVALAAPTGKAAARLAESVRGLTGDNPNLKLTHGTVHRLLGPRPESVFFKFSAAHPLPYDIVVLDEASMMDLPLMAKLVDAIDPDVTRLLMLGDPGQLPSIYSGSMLADIVAAAERGDADNPVAPCFVRLTKNHRSGAQMELAALVDAVRSGDATHALTLLSGDGLCLERPPTADEMPDFVERELQPYLRAVCAATDPVEALAAVGSYRLICMLRQGPCGADAVNERALDFAWRTGLASRGERFYHGLPIVVTRNDHTVGLYNGDSGVILRVKGRLLAFFDVEGGPRSVPVQSLPPVAPAYALTVHRAQGSEYGAVTLLLPPSDHPLLTRELFYTGVSRARSSVKVMGTPELVKLALARTERRASGLAGRLV